MSHLVGALFLMLIGALGLVYGAINFRDPTRLRRSFLTRGAYGWMSDEALRIVAAAELAILFLLLLAAFGFAIAELREI